MWNRLQGLMAELLPGWARDHALRRERRRTLHAAAYPAADEATATRPASPEDRRKDRQGDGRKGT